MKINQINCMKLNILMKEQNRKAIKEKKKKKSLTIIYINFMMEEKWSLMLLKVKYF